MRRSIESDLGDWDHKRESVNKFHDEPTKRVSSVVDYDQSDWVALTSDVSWPRESGQMQKALPDSVPRKQVLGAGNNTYQTETVPQDWPPEIKDQPISMCPESDMFYGVAEIVTPNSLKTNAIEMLKRVQAFHNGLLENVSRDTVERQTLNAINELLLSFAARPLVDEALKLLKIDSEKILKDMIEALPQSRGGRISRERWLKVVEERQQLLERQIENPIFIARAEELTEDYQEQLFSVALGGLQNEDQAQNWINIMKRQAGKIRVFSRELRRHDDYKNKPIEIAAIIQIITEHPSVVLCDDETPLNAGAPGIGGQIDRRNVEKPSLAEQLYGPSDKRTLPEINETLRAASRVHNKLAAPFARLRNLLDYELGSQALHEIQKEILQVCIDELLDPATHREIHNSLLQANLDDNDLYQLVTTRPQRSLSITKQRASEVIQERNQLLALQKLEPGHAMQARGVCYFYQNHMCEQALNTPLGESIAQSLRDNQDKYAQELLAFGSSLCEAKCNPLLVAAVIRIISAPPSEELRSYE